MSSDPFDPRSPFAGIGPRFDEDGEGNRRVPSLVQQQFFELSLQNLRAKLNEAINQFADWASARAERERKLQQRIEELEEALAAASQSPSTSGSGELAIDGTWADEREEFLVQLEHDKRLLAEAWARLEEERIAAGFPNAAAVGLGTGLPSPTAVASSPTGSVAIGGAGLVGGPHAIGHGPRVIESATGRPTAIVPPPPVGVPHPSPPFAAPSSPVPVPVVSPPTSVSSLRPPNNSTSQELRRQLEALQRDVKRNAR